MDEPKESSERPDRVLVLVEQLIHMVAENNRMMADLRSEVAGLRSEVADLRAEITGVEQRLTARLNDTAEQQKQDRALWQAEGRHFAHAIGVLQRDVAVLKER